MGWTGGTPLFDGCVTVALNALASRQSGAVSEDDKYEIVKYMYEVFEDSDWDTEDESGYFIPYLIDVMHDMGRIDDEYYQEFKHSV